MTLLASAAVVVATLIAASACGGGEGPTGTDPIPRLNASVDVRERLGSTAERYAPVVAEQRVTKRCMAARGFEFEVADRADLLEADRFQRLEDVFYFGPPPRPDIESFGASSSQTTFMTLTSDPNAALQERMGDGEREAWFSAYLGAGSELYSYTDPATGNSIATPKDGCSAQASVEVYGDFGTYAALSSFPLRFADLVYQTALADPAMEAVLADWRECVGGLGYDFSYPSELFGQVATAIGANEAAEDLEATNFGVGVTCGSEVPIFDAGWGAVERALPAVEASEAGTISLYRAAINRAQLLLEE